MTKQVYILTITDVHGTRQEPYSTRETAERAIRVLSEYSEKIEVSIMAAH